jgi:hypothetical protein
MSKLEVVIVLEEEMVTICRYLEGGKVFKCGTLKGTCGLLICIV